MNIRNNKLFLFLRFPRACFLLFVAIIFISSCSQPGSNSPTRSETSVHRNFLAKAGDFAPGQLEAHYSKHGYQFGNITQDQYLERAQKLLNASPGNDIQEKIRPNGDALHYKVSTGEFAVMDRNGRIRTYFKANYTYWMKQ